MKLFIINCGSSSIKYQLFSMNHEQVLAKGMLERVGTNEARIRHRTPEANLEVPVQAADHTDAMNVIIETLLDPRVGVLESVDEIEGVGHRVVHGGEDADKSSRIDDELIAIIKKNAELAPLHNPPNLMGIEAAMAAIPNCPHVAVFDTAFLSTLPPRAYRYGVPEAWYTDYHVRRYGFHGTSHRYVTFKTAELVGKDVSDCNLIICHLGNGCSITAVQDGKAVDHSMGLTPLEGVMMGTRCGDIDPAMIKYMLDKGLSIEEIDNTLNKKSGLLGISGKSNDMRDLLDIVENEEDGADKAALAMEMFNYRIAKYIGAYFAILPSVNAVVLTGGVGENSWQNRVTLCEMLKNIGVKIDENRNEQIVQGKSGLITENGSDLPVWIIPTNEELMIARDTRRIVARG